MKKKRKLLLLTLLTLMTVLMLFVGCSVKASELDENKKNILTQIELSKYSLNYNANNTDYTQLIISCALERTEESFKLAKKCEEMRNSKIKSSSSNYLPTSYFKNTKYWDEVFKNSNSIRFGKKIDESVSHDIYYIYGDSYKMIDTSIKKRKYTDEDVYWLAMVITKEMGIRNTPEYVRNYVGCVVLNRVESNRFPNTIYDVVHQPGQYPWAVNKHYREPFEWCKKTAVDLLEGNRMLPKDIIFQAEFKQGSYVYAQYYDEILRTTTYFCGK